MWAVRVWELTRARKAKVCEAEGMRNERVCVCMWAVRVRVWEVTRATERRSVCSGWGGMRNEGVRVWLSLHV